MVSEKEIQDQEERIQQSFKRCRDFYLSGKTRSIAFRKEQLKSLMRILDQEGALIYQALKADLNKSQAESYMTELSIIKEEIRYMLRHLRRLAKPKRRLPAISQLPGSLRITYEPYGVALIMSPWNYPLLLTLGPLVDAIAAGNTVVLKPSAYSPQSSRVIGELCERAFEPGLCEVIEGGRQENQALLHLPFDKLFFTGSPQVGKYVMEQASKDLIPATLELGGKSPCIIDRTADLKITAKRILFGKLTNAGQTCVAPDYVLVESSVKDQLIRELLKGIEEAFPDRAYVNENYVRMVQEKHFYRMLELLDGQNLIYPQNAKELFSTLPNQPAVYGDVKSLQLMPVLVDEPPLDSRIMQEEIFGPLLPILAWDDEESLFQSLQGKEKPLALYLFSKDKERAKRLLTLVSSGGVAINDTLLHMASCKAPFGGVGQSGMGNYHGDHGFYTFSHERTVLRKAWHFDVPMRHHPYTEKGYRFMKRILG